MHEKPKHERFQEAGERGDMPNERQRRLARGYAIHEADSSHAGRP